MVAGRISNRSFERPLAELALCGGKAIRGQRYPDWPYFDGREEAQLLDVLRSGVWGGYSSKIGAFEQKFGAYLGADHCIAVSNGTVSLEMSLRAEGIGRGDEVIVPPFTFMATASAVLQCGALPVFADVEANSLNLDPAKFEQAITDRTRAVIPVHFAGHAADMDAIIAIARRHGIVVIEDAAHAHGSEYKGIRLGTIGEWGSFSFQSSKIMTSGEGGCLVTQTHTRDQRARSYRNHGRSGAGGWYDHQTLGSNLRLSGFQAAVLLSQLERLDEQIALRSANATRLRRALSTIPGISPLTPADYCTRHSEAFFLIRLQDKDLGVNKVQFESALKAEGIPVMLTYPRPLYSNPLFERWPSRNTGCPVAEASCMDVAALPLNVLMAGSGDIDDVVSAVQKIVRNVGELRAGQSPDSPTNED